MALGPAVSCPLFVEPFGLEPVSSPSEFVGQIFDPAPVKGDVKDDEGDKYDA